ncbi:hypothetical protein LCGC14_1364740 [marine sediment metagenome]|uniref:Uncharacterized protein n=1 Tax=marine sediment metagenome TaxID=412755 RepID=A0A0F9MMA0_9ZZZZ
MTTNEPTVSNENKCLNCEKSFDRFIIFCTIQCKQAYYDKLKRKLQAGKLTKSISKRIYK